MTLTRHAICCLIAVVIGSTSTPNGQDEGEPLGFWIEEVQDVAESQTHVGGARGGARASTQSLKLDHVDAKLAERFGKTLWIGTGLGFEAVESSNSLLVSGPPDELHRASELVNALDELAAIAEIASDSTSGEDWSHRPVTLVPRVIPADLAAETFTELFGSDEGFKALATSYNLVLVQGTPQQIEAISTFLSKTRELVTSSLKSQSRALKLDRIDAALAQRVLATLMEGSKDFRAEVNPTTNQLVVSGTADEMEKVDTILRTLGEVPTKSGTAKQELRVFDLVGVDAHIAATLIQNLADDAPNLRIDGTTNQLFVRGTEEQLEFVAKVLDELQKTEPRQLKVYHLRNSDATELAAMLKELLGNQNLSLSVDARSNSIVASALPDMLSVIQAILLTLDAEDVAGSQARGKASLKEPNVRAPGAREERNSSTFGVEYASSKRAAATRAAIYRWAEASGGHSDEELRKMKSDLQAAVERAFAARQEAQSAEVEQLREQLNAIQTRVRQREAIKEQIVERRVADLLANVDTSWWPQAPAASDGTVTQVQTLPEKLDPNELPNPHGKVQIEHIEGLDILVLRGKAEDVEAVQKVIERMGRQQSYFDPEGDAAEEKPRWQY